MTDELTTPAQRTFIHSRELEFGNAVVDLPVTNQIRAAERNAHNWIVVSSNLPGTEVRMWVVDAGGDVIMEGGLGGGRG